MITKILMYFATVILFPPISMLAMFIPATFLGLLNNWLRKYDINIPPHHSLSYGLFSLKTLGLLFLIDWFWKLFAAQNIPIIIMPILLAYQIIIIKNPKANYANTLFTAMDMVGIVLFVPIHIALVGTSNINWW